MQKMSSFSLATCLFCLAGLSTVFPQGDAQQVSTCPLGWTTNRNSCYFTGERFNGQTWYSAAAFCQSLGAHLVELNDLDEFNYINAAAKQVSWVDGPWIGILRPFGDNRWVLPSLRAESNDADLNKLMEDIAQGSSYDCAGLDKRGKLFGFWRCRNGGSPYCEIDLKVWFDRNFVRYRKHSSNCTWEFISIWHTIFKTIFTTNTRKNVFEKTIDRSSTE